MINRTDERLRVPALAMLLSLALALGLVLTTLSSALAPLSAHAITPGSRGTTLGSTSYSAPSGSIYVSTQGSDSNPGTQASPVRTIARALVLAPAGGTVVLRAGTYHESVILKKKVTIQNHPGEVVWLDGSSPVSNWTRSGSVWTAPWTTFFGTQNYHGGVRPEYPNANRVDQLFLNGTALKQVGSQAAVTAGTFFADIAGKKLVIGSDPTGKSVAASTLNIAIEAAASDVTLRGFGVRRYSSTSPNGDARGAIQVATKGGVFEHLIISDNAAIGLSVASDGKTIRNVVSERNGMIGLSIYRSNNTFSNTVLAAGLWLDGFNRNPTIINNTLSNNGAMQLNLEMALRSVVANNDFTGGVQSITSRDSEDVIIMNNRFNAYTLQAINLAQDRRWSSKPSDAPADFTLRSRKILIANNSFGCGTRFQIFANDESRSFSADQFDMNIVGNVFSPRQTNPALALAYWGAPSGNGTFHYQVSELSAKNANWKNLQATSCTSSPETTKSAAELASVAHPMPAAVAKALGTTSGLKTVGLLKTGVTAPNPAPKPDSDTPGAATPTNVKPTAAFTASSSGRVVSLDASGSRDSDGSIVSYEWAFGDGTRGTGVKTQHTYSKDGGYLVWLTVTDNRGAAAILTQLVDVKAGAVTAQPAQFVDTFSRSASGTWSTADSGQPWVLSGGNAAFSVAGGEGAIALTARANREAYPAIAAATSNTASAQVGVNALPRGGNANVSVIGRKVGADHYAGRIVIRPDGAARLYALRGETPIASSIALGTFTSGTRYNLKVEVTGTSPTTVKIKAWTGTEPAAWNITATDSTGGLQSAGTAGLKTNLDASATGSTTILVNEYRLQVK